jgi:hypothetical protein
MGVNLVGRRKDVEEKILDVAMVALRDGTVNDQGNIPVEVLYDNIGNICSDDELEVSVVHLVMDGEIRIVNNSSIEILRGED